MFVKVQDPTFAEALNISNFDQILVHRVESGYALSVAKLPLSDMNRCHTIATFSNERQAIFAFNHLMNAIAEGKNHLSLD